MKKGILEMCILYIISKKEMYGYEIMRLTKQAFPEVNEATIYTILRRLHSDNFTDTNIGSTSNGPQRKYYKITVLGTENLKKSIEEWKLTVWAVHMLGIE
jgi:PadR family transcriptional regulator PadR